MARTAQTPLTGRERDALATLCNNLGNGRIARAMGVNPSTLHRWLSATGRPSDKALLAARDEAITAREELEAVVFAIGCGVVSRQPGNSQPR